MNTITLTIAATPDNLKRLADAFGDVIDETLSGDAVPARRISATKDAETKDVPVLKSAEIPAPPVPEKPETVAKEPETVAKEPENVAKPEITKEELRALGLRRMKEGFSGKIKEILKEYGAPKITELPEEHFAAVYEKLEALA